MLKFLISSVFTHCNWGCLILGDISLQVIGKKSAAGATYKSMELVVCFIFIITVLSNCHIMYDDQIKHIDPLVTSNLNTTKATTLLQLTSNYFFYVACLRV